MPSRVTPAPRGRTSRRAYLVGGALLVAFAGGAFLLSRCDPRPNPPEGPRPVERTRPGPDERPFPRTDERPVPRPEDRPAPSGDGGSGGYR